MATEISGQVTFQDDPVDGADVYAVVQGTDTVLSTTTASDGTYSFGETALEPGENTYHVMVVTRDTDGNPIRYESQAFIVAEGVEETFEQLEVDDFEYDTESDFYWGHGQYFVPITPGSGDPDPVNGDKILEHERNDSDSLMSHPDGPVTALPNYPVRGDDFRFYTYPTGTNIYRHYFFHSTTDDSVVTPPAYVASIWVGNDEIRIEKRTSSGISTVVSTTASLSTGQWYELDVETFDDSSDIVLTVSEYDPSDGSKTEVGSVQTTDSDYQGQGIGWRPYSTGYHDWWHIYSGETTNGDNGDTNGDEEPTDILVIDDMEGGLHSGWTGSDTSEFEAWSNRQVEGDHSVRAISAGNDSLIITSSPGDGLPNYPGYGDRFHFHFYNSGDETGLNHVYRWGRGSGSGWADIFFQAQGNEVRLRRENLNGHDVTEETTSQYPPYDTWIDVEITWDDGSWGLGDHVHQARMFDLGPNGDQEPEQVGPTMDMTVDLGSRQGIRAQISQGLGQADEFLWDWFHIEEN